MKRFTQAIRSTGAISEECYMMSHISACALYPDDRVDAEVPSR